MRRSLVQTLNGLHTAVQGICELRNTCGFASHGSDSTRPMLESIQALLAAETADAIVGFLYRIHQQERVFPSSTQVGYDDNPDFNERVDEAHLLVRIFELEFKPSEILFRMDPEAYRVYLAEYKLEPTTDQGILEDPNSGEVTP